MMFEKHLSLKGYMYSFRVKLVLYETSNCKGNHSPHEQVNALRNGIEFCI